MSISTVNGRMVITSELPCDEYCEARARTKALLNLLASITDRDRLDTEDVFAVCEMIHDLLPTDHEYDLLERACVKIKHHATKEID